MPPLPPPLPMPKGVPLPRAGGATPPPLPTRALPPPIPGRNSPPPLRVPTASPVGVGHGGANSNDPLSGQAQTRYGRYVNTKTGVVTGQWVRVQSTWLWALKFVPYAQAEDEALPMPHEQ